MLAKQRITVELVDLDKIHFASAIFLFRVSPQSCTPSSATIIFTLALSWIFISRSRSGFSSSTPCSSGAASRACILPGNCMVNSRPERTPGISATTVRTESNMTERGQRHDEERVNAQKDEHEDEPNTLHSLDKALILLRASDDTSRFVGLALLKSMLDNHTELRENPEIITKCWDAIPASFLDRLIRARPSGKRSEEEAQNMIGLAVAVMHAFLTLLPQEALNFESFRTRLDKLSAAEPYW